MGKVCKVSRDDRKETRTYLCRSRKRPNPKKKDEVNTKLRHRKKLN